MEQLLAEGEALSEWEVTFEAQVRRICGTGDPAHDLAHFRRVVTNAKRLAEAEGACLDVVVPAAWLHDFVLVPKDSPLRSQASRIAAEAAAAWLRAQGYPPERIDEIEHCILCHSFSAGIPPRSLEARVVQDADRLDALGAIGIGRCLMLGAVMGRPLYDDEEPIPRRRPADDGRSSIDHFFTKLLKLGATMQTDSGRAEAIRRTEFLHIYLRELAREIGLPEEGASPLGR